LSANASNQQSDKSSTATGAIDAPMDGGAVVADVLAREGVEALFTLCGGHISPILVGCKARGIRVVDTRDEKHAAFAADAMARLTGNVGVAAVTAGPGVTNAITAMKNAQMAQSPLLLLGGATATILEGRGSLQDIDQLSLLRPCCKWAVAVSSLSALAPTLERAIALARDGVPGPVFVEIPLDLLYREELVREWYRKESGVDKLSGLKGKAVDLYLRQHLFRQFKLPSWFSARPPLLAAAKAALPRLVTKPAEVLPALPPLVGLPRGGEEAVQEAMELLAHAERPALVIGSQTLAGCKDASSLERAVEQLGMPTFLAGMARGLLGRAHPLQLRHKRGAALKEADCVLVCGFPFDFRLGYGRSINGKAKVIAVNLEASALRQNRKPQLPVLDHPARFLERLAAQASVLPRAADDSVRWPAWQSRLREREAARDAEIAAQGEGGAQGGAAGGVNPIALFAAIEARMSDDASIVVDGGDFAATGAYVLRPRGPLRWLDPGVFGTLGVGGGFAVAAAVNSPGAQVWLIYGDGSSAYSLAEFDTCARHGLAPIAVIGTDGLWAQIAREQGEILGDDVGTTLERRAYEKVAEGYGAVGLRLEDPARIEAVVDAAIEHAAAGRPVVINAMLAASDFRKGSLSM
jgi:acetolactate synthase-like protein